VLEYAPGGSSRSTTSSEDNISVVQSASADEALSSDGGSRKGESQIIRQIIQEKTGADKGKLVPTSSGMLIADFLNDHFNQVVDYGFTAELEEDMDNIANGEAERNKILEQFYTPFHKLSEQSGSIDRSQVAQAREIGIDPKSGKPVLARIGRFGPMLQLGATEDKDNKPQFAPMPANARVDTVTLEEALHAFKLPRVVGETKDGQSIKANVGRFGPYIQVGKLFVSIKPLDPHEITLDQALDLYAEKLKAEAEKNITDFGDGIKVLKGRYGPYITDGTKNAKIPKDIEPQSITHEQAKEMIEAAPASKGRFARKSTGKKALAKKPAAKKKPASPKK
jgi:DNA topoisomerase-1